MYENRTLVRGDNLEEMRKFPDECIDLIATDPPFNSKRDYFIPYRDEHGQEPNTLLRAFSDTWNWGEAAEDAYNDLIVEVGGQVGDTIQGLRQFLNQTPMMAYLVMMAIRLVEMHRILKSTGSLYLHCDPSASHYLKIVLDSVFGNKNFRNEIVWCYAGGNPSLKNYPKKHDILLRYTMSKKYTFNVEYKPYSNHNAAGKRFSTKGMSKRRGVNYRAEGTPVNDWWTDIKPLINLHRERLGYPTQKPRSLYERILQASSNKGDFVLDPFCGCGTTLMAAKALERQWIGIDLTYLAIGAVKTQAEKFFSTGTGGITVIGTPEDENTALELARTKPHAFEEWCVTHVLKFKKGPNGGVDGTFNFPLGKIKGKQEYGKAIAQVKGGNYIPGHIRDFRTAIRNEKADLGVFIVTYPPTDGMRAEAARSGTYNHPNYEFSVPRLQIYEIQDYFRGNLPKLPHAERVVL